jgi:hypothetical protein
VDDFSLGTARWQFRGEFSSQSSGQSFLRAQRNCFCAIVSARFPHFHSDGYYYCLYPYTKTGYSSRSKPQFRERLPPEEIQQWNSV